MKCLLFVFVVLFTFNAFAVEVDSKKIDYLQYNDSDTQIDDLFFAKDLVVGDLNAPITIIEYYSFSCVHCMEFNSKIMPILKKDYIDKGKVKLILRDFPLDKASLYASTLFRCYANNVHCIDKENCNGRNYFDFNSAILASRENWDSKNVFDIINSEAIKNGMNKDELDKCLNDSDLQNKIVHSKLIGIRKLNINAIPTVFINKKQYTENPAEFIGFIDNLLKSLN